ncbi:CoA transferase [Nevskia sp.]|uniref:CaiB/BaiF CoA transferase family protein n=1 Tax=Nevskia sp. TaxID=1929292 RepID=UPI0025F6DE7F|nr:CoA transferase [Nevskia sp.]
MTVLAGVTVLDLSRLMAGPYAAMALAHYGARVIKIESLEGEEGRGFGPPFCGEVAALFMMSNRGKESLCLDFRKPAGRTVLEKLVARADVLIHSFRLDFAERQKLRYEDLALINPRLVHYSVSAYGSDSAYRLKPSVDSVIQGVAGGFYGAGEEKDPPIRNSLPIVDVASGMCGVNGILAALMERQKSGRGQAVELTLMGTMLTFLGSKIAEASIEGHCEREINPAIVAPSRHFQGSDQRWFTLTVINDAAFARLCKLVGRPEWTSEDRFRDNASRIRHRTELLAMLAGIFSTRTARAWITALDSADIPAGPVNTVPDMLADPVLRSLLGQHADVPGLPQPEFPVRSERGMRDVAALRRAPGLGEHSRSVLTELGYDSAQIGQLSADAITRLGGAPRLQD